MTEGTQERLTDLDVLRLSAAISAADMESIGLAYMGLGIERIISLKDGHRDNHITFNRDVIRNWMRRNSSSDQKQVSFFNI